MDLANKKVLSHEQMQKLGPQEILAYLSQLGQGWEFLETNKIVKEFKFQDFIKAMEFVNKVALLADEAGHHPDIAISYSKVEITLWTHFVKGLSKNESKA